MINDINENPVVFKSLTSVSLIKVEIVSKHSLRGFVVCFNVPWQPLMGYIFYVSCCCPNGNSQSKEM